MSGANALAGQNRATFDVKSALAESDDLRQRLHDMMNPPSIDKDELESALLVAEMADWAYDIDAALEGAQLVTKQTFSQRSDATEAEKDRAREEIIFAIEQSKYLLNQSSFYEGLLPLVATKNPLTVDENAGHLLPQLIPAQLATARIFTDGIRKRADDLGVGLLFDPRLVAYVSVLREIKADWDDRLHKKAMDATAPPQTPSTDASAGAAPVKPDANTSTTDVGFNPGNTYNPPHTVLAVTSAKKLSDTARCLIWVNHDCEIATLDEKYLKLSGTVDPITHEWHVKDRAKLETLLQAAEIGARHGVAFAEKAEIDPSVLAMIYEKAAQLRIQGDEASDLEALRNYWRCALLGNMCWQLAFAHKAQPVDLFVGPPGPAATNKPAPAPTTQASPTPAVPAATPTPAPAPTATTQASPTPAIPAATPAPAPAPATQASSTPAVPAATPAPAPAPATQASSTPAVPAATPAPAPAPVAATPAPANAPASASDANDAKIPVAPVARVEDYATAGSTPATNAAPLIGPTAPNHKPADNADGHDASFP
jgi:hypothetical protein